MSIEGTNPLDIPVKLDLYFNSNRKLNPDGNLKLNAVAHHTFIPSKLDNETLMSPAYHYFNNLKMSLQGSYPEVNLSYYSISYGLYAGICFDAGESLKDF